MTREIRKLETLARQLEMSPEERAEITRDVVDFGESFIQQLDTRPAYVEAEEQTAGLYDTAIGEDPKSVAQLLEVIETHLLGAGINGASGGHMGYIPISTLHGAALGDYLAAVINRYSSLFYASPGSVRMANQLLRWMVQLLGLPEGAHGNLTTSGSLAHLIGVVTAREAHHIKARDFHRTVVYLNEQTHYCVEKALRVAGMGECVRRMIPVDANYRMKPEALEECIRRDKEQGLIPWMIVGNAGSTNTGAIDPLETLAELAGKYGLWFQVDAAYGGFFMLLEEFRPRLAGIEAADAVVLDPHKGLFIPCGLGAVLIRDPRLTLAAHSFEASYLQDAESMPHEPSPAEMSPELTQHFRALRLWFPLHYHGLKPIRAALREKLALADYAWERLAEAGFEMGPRPQVTVIVFRYVPAVGDADAFNKELHRRILEDGRVFLTTTQLEGHFTIRLTVLSYRSHLETVDLAVDLLCSNAETLENQNRNMS